MREIYGGILDRIVAQDYDVFTRRARVSTLKKLAIATSAWWQARAIKGEPVSSA